MDNYDNKYNLLVYVMIYYTYVCSSKTYSHSMDWCRMNFYLRNSVQKQ